MRGTVKTNRDAGKILSFSCIRVISTALSLTLSLSWSTSLIHISKLKDTFLFGVFTMSYSGFMNGWPVCNVVIGCNCLMIVIVLDWWWCLPGLVLTVITSSVFIRYNQTPVVKSSSRELSYTILIGTFQQHIDITNSRIFIYRTDLPNDIVGPKDTVFVFSSKVLMINVLEMFVEGISLCFLSSFTLIQKPNNVTCIFSR